MAGARTSRRRRGHGSLCRRAGGRRRGSRPVCRARCRRRHRRLVRSAAGRRRSRAGHDRPADGHLPGLREQPRAGRRSRRHGRLRQHRRQLGDRQGVRSSRRRHLAADGEPSSRAERDRAKRRRRALRAREGHDDDLVVHPEPARPALDHRGDERPRAGSGPRDCAGGRRRFRREDQRVRRGFRGRRHLEATRHSDQVERGSLGGVRGDEPRSRHHRLRGSRGEARRHGARHQAAPHRRRRGVQLSVHRDDSDVDHADGQRDLRHPCDSRDGDGGVHQQDADRCLPWSRAARSHLLRRARDGHARARTEDRSG